MITPSDESYKATKRLKQRKSRPTPPFDELADWIGSNWDVTVLNAIYESANHLHAPRIEVVLEHQREAQEFHRGVNFDDEKQTAVASKFIELVSSNPNYQFDTNRLFVIFSAFAPLAHQEADSQITDKQIEKLKARIANPNLWEISRCFGSVTFMFYTDEQVRESKKKGLEKNYAKMYFELLKKHDEFGYLSEDEFIVSFDSKENFDKNYGSSWFNYHR